MGKGEFRVTWSQVLGPEQLVEAIRRADLEPCQLSTTPVPSRLARILCPHVCLDFAELGPAMVFNGVMPADAYSLVFVRKCERTGHAFNFSIDHRDGYIGFFPPGSEIDAFTPEGYSNATLTVPVAVFHEAVERVFPEIPGRILKHGAGVPISPRGKKRINLLLGLVMETIDDPALPLSGEFARSELERMLIDAFLEGLREGIGAPSRGSNHRVAGRLKHLRQARDFIRESAGTPVHLGDLCDAVGMSQRGVENLFKKSFGVTPATFIRHQRLHGARNGLLGSRAEHGRVKQVALEWGFWHMGHFSNNYRQLFGESPSVTLGRNAHR